MKIRIDQAQHGMDILVGELGDNQQEMLEAFQACQEGRCTCPTDEYKKLESLDIQPGDDSLTLHLTVKAGQTLEPAEIEKCLHHTRDQVEGRGSADNP